MPSRGGAAVRARRRYPPCKLSTVLRNRRSRAAPSGRCRDRQGGPLRRPALHVHAAVLLREPGGGGPGQGDLRPLHRPLPVPRPRLQRGEPFGVWGGEFLVDGQVVAVRARPRPASQGRPPDRGRRGHRRTRIRSLIRDRPRPGSRSKPHTESATHWMKVTRPSATLRASTAARSAMSGTTRCTEPTLAGSSSEAARRRSRRRIGHVVPLADREPGLGDQAAGLLRRRQGQLWPRRRPTAPGDGAARRSPLRTSKNASRPPATSARRISAYICALRECSSRRAGSRRR